VTPSADGRRKIQILPDHVANKIAAGEVIQRPDSAAKELLENALDAGATRITVTVKDGGVTYLQVADNGTGMDQDDAVASFLRHATSKISTYEDLEEIRTYGFRGEALASIAAVAQVTMKTRRAGDDAAVMVRIDGGGQPRVTREAREQGTTVTIQNLFFNVPARKKFLKSRATEFRHVYEAVHRVAISHPELELRFVNGDDTIFNLKPAALETRLSDVFGERLMESLIPVEERTEALSLSGYIGKPSFGQKTRTHQYLFLNGRFIVHRNISHAVFSSYENLLLKGTFPFFILFIEVDPRRVDVNVHPSKMEAKFDDEQGIYRMAGALVRKGLSGAQAFPVLSMDQGSPGSDVELQFSPRQHRWPSADSPWPPAPVDTATGEIFPPHESGGNGMASSLLAPPGREEVPPRQGSVLTHQADRPEGDSHGLIWQLHNKYILCQIRSGLMIVDQHVAHERVLYERALERFKTGFQSAQQLLFPYTVQMTPGDYALVEELFRHFQMLGFDLALFGRNTLSIQGVPADVKAGSEERIVQEILGLYKEYQQQGMMDARDNLAKSFSCRSAIKAGDPLNEQEMRSLIDQLFATSMPYVCPHGRPIVLRISTEELDRRFGRL
jgi:DNA mismatch repair protein MutL